MLINTQPAEKRQPLRNTLQVNSVFYTIQGEGPFAGKSAVFVRLAGCNLQCPMCDTEYVKRIELDITEALAAVTKAIPTYGERPMWNSWLPIVVITGGEPFRQHLTSFVEKLLGEGFTVQIETNGTFYEDGFPYSHKNVYVVCSPKTGRVHPRLTGHLAALKYVATANSLDAKDGLPRHALEHPNAGGLARPMPGFKGTVYLQPVDEQDPVKNADNLQAVVESCLKFRYTLCMQIHKLIGVE